MKLKFVNMLLLVVMMLVSFSYHTEAKESTTPTVENGVIDLQEWTPAHAEEIIPLNGKWEFYWNQLLLPHQFQQTRIKPSYIHAPSEWSKQHIDGKSLPNQGYATYRLTILLNKQAVNQSLALYIPASCSAYKVWVNNKAMAESGIVGKNTNQETPWTVSHVIYFTPSSEKLDIIVQISNFHQRKNGMWDSFLLGSADSITKKDNLDFSFQLLMTGALLIMSIFYFFTYFFRRTNVMALYFSGICIMLSIRLSVTDGYILRNFIPDTTFSLVNKLEYVSISLGIFFLIHYISHLFPDEKHSFVCRALSFLSGLYSIFILVSPVVVFTSTIFMLPAIVVLTCTYHMFYVYRVAIINKRDWAWANMLVSFIMIIAVVNDGFYYIGNMTSTILANSGFFIFFLIQIMTIADQMSKAYHKLESVSARLLDLNANLENKVNERTKELAALNEKLLASNEKLTKIEASRRKFLSNISHDLGTPMQSALGFVEMLLKGMIKENQQRYLQIIFEKLTFINKLTDDLFELTKMEEKQIAFYFQEIDIEKFLNEMGKKVSLDFSEKNLFFELGPMIGIEQGEKVYAQIDIFRMEQVLHNLLQNAMKFTPEGGTVQLYSAMNHENQNIMISISDSGIGIDKELLPEIFERFMKANAARNHPNHEGVGLGLAIAKEIVLAHHGEILVDSEVGRGSTFTIVLPVWVE